jgi:hypothetical protein
MNRLLYLRRHARLHPRPESIQRRLLRHHALQSRLRLKSKNCATKFFGSNCS